MADITKCTQASCPLAGTCYRRTAPDSYWQSWAAFEYRQTADGVQCDHYWKDPYLNIRTRGNTDGD